MDELGPASSAWIVMVSDPAKSCEGGRDSCDCGAAVWSHDGAKIVYLAQAKTDAPPGYSDMYTYDLTTKTTTNLTDGFMGTVDTRSRLRCWMVGCCRIPRRASRRG